MTIEQSYNYRKEIEDSDIQKTNFLYPIGINGSYDGINLGIEGDKKDKIFWVNEDEITFISDSIFDFIRGLDIWTVKEDPDLASSVPFDKLYKNWGDEIWQLKD